MSPLSCYRCNAPVLQARAAWLADLVDRLMAVLPEPMATEFGDQLVFGRVPEECMVDEIRVALCGDCTLQAVNQAVTS